MDNEHSAIGGDLKVENFTDLVDLVSRGVSHSHVDENQRLVSTLFVKVPLWSGIDHIWRMHREVEAPYGDHAANEMVAATEVFARELKYILENSNRIEEPVYAHDEELGRGRCIGRDCYIVDRKYLKLPSIAQDDDGVTFLDCVKG